MTEKIILPNGFLEVAQESLEAGKSVRVLADGSSMYPFIRGGKDVVEIVPVSKDASLSPMICLFCKWGDRYIIHRLIGCEGEECVLQGDGNLRGEERVSRGNVIGRISRIYAPDGKVQDCTDPRWLRLAKLWYHLRPIRRILLSLLHRLRIR